VKFIRQILPVAAGFTISIETLALRRIRQAVTSHSTSGTESNFVSSVNDNNHPSRDVRLLLGITGIGLILVFVIAWRLTPDVRGYGTHQQLGLPPCTFRRLMGVQCPHCGMTTSFANIVRGNLKAAWDANPMGIPLAMIFASGIPWCLSVAVRGRWLGTQEPFFWFIVLGIGYLSVSLVCWVFQHVITF